MTGIWIAKIMKNGEILCEKAFENERGAMVLIQRTSEFLKGRCQMTLLQHVVRVSEETSEIYPRRISVAAKKRDVVILEANFKDI